MMEQITKLNHYWTDIYFYLHYPHEDKISHQAVRILQLIEKQPQVGVNEVASFLHISPNTASEHVKRLLEKKYIIKDKNAEDQRKVIICLTELGKNILHRNTSLDEDKLQTVLEKLSDSEKVMIEKALEILSEGAKKCMY
ncbi:MarR family winged helix-turn-helix transcriptional regulator [Psychrobacillus sp. FSL H8-0483]|uniref:MarR family winged helix-turn-helix transcriptional regulator n=1 Tax=Psychrobacillus sp. FSL H8-0483 TaxID=2921389 RepID=UPI003159BF9C